MSLLHDLKQAGKEDKCEFKVIHLSTNINVTLASDVFINHFQFHNTNNITIAHLESFYPIFHFLFHC